MPTKAEEIIATCENNFETGKADCNLFVKSVASKFGVTLTGNADKITEEITEGGWTPIANGIEAKAKADAGWLVIVGIMGKDYDPKSAHGHVCVVVSGSLDTTYKKYPTAYWGRLGGIGEKSKTVNYAYNAKSVDRVVYGGKVV